MTTFNRIDDAFPLPVSALIASGGAGPVPDRVIPGAAPAGRVACTRVMRSALVDRFPCAVRDLGARRIDETCLTALDVVVWSYEWYMLAPEKLAHEVALLRDALITLDRARGTRVRERSAGGAADSDGVADPALTVPADCLGLPVGAIAAWVDVYGRLSAAELLAWTQWNRRVAKGVRTPWEA